MQIIYVLRVAIFSLFTRTLICIHTALTAEPKWIRSETMTNFEKIKSMSINDMTQFLFVHQFDKCVNCGYYQKQCNGYYFDDKSCTTGIKHWLESEVEE